MRTTTPLFLTGICFTALSLNAQEKWDISKIDLSKLPSVADKKNVTYAKDIRPLFEASCFRCHGEQRPKAGLRLDSLEAVLKGGEDGKVVIAGDSKKSLLVAAVAHVNDEIAMPPKRVRVGAVALAALAAPGALPAAMRHPEVARTRRAVRAEDLVAQAALKADSVRRQNL